MTGTAQPINALDKATTAVQEVLFDLSLHMDRIDSITRQQAELIAWKAIRAFQDHERST